jgi:crotonobetainyl-CoA:carnitine CoA-transferase CaiB-like acyl-CoA transferase
MSRLPLDGITVLDLGQIYNAPYTTLLMALAGARVIKVEPRWGDNLRGRAVGQGTGAPFAMLNSNKTGVTLDLRSERGKQLLKDMARRADVLVENFRPGVMERLGVGSDVLRAENPRLVYAAGSGFGRTGPYRDFPAMDLTVQAISGIMSVTGFPDRPPVKAGPAVCDFSGGIHLYGAVVTALFDRERTGEGQVVEASMYESVYTSMSSSLGLFFGAGPQAVLRTGNRHNGLAEAPYNTYPTSDGWVAIICVTDAHWRILAREMGREDLAEHPDFAVREARWERIPEIDDLVSAWTKDFGTDELFERLRTSRIPCAPVRDLAAVTTDEHLHARGMLRELDHPDLGRVTLPHSPLRYGDADGETGAELVPSPRLGEHNEEVFCGWLGLSREELDELEREEVV